MTSHKLFVYALGDFGPDMPTDWLTAAQTTASLTATLSHHAQAVQITLDGDRLAGAIKLGGLNFATGDPTAQLWQLVDPDRGVRLTALRFTARDRENGAELGSYTALATALPLKGGQTYALSLPVSGTSGRAPLLVGFAAGTRILTVAGKRPVEDLVPGDLIWTEFQGFQPLLWRGTYSLPARGVAAPVRLRPGTAGLQGDLVLAAQQGVRIDTAAGAVLAPASAFARAGHAQRDFGGQIKWYQLLLPGHALIQVQGLCCDSLWAPALQTGTADQTWPKGWPAAYVLPKAPALPRITEAEAADHLS